MQLDFDQLLELSSNSINSLILIFIGKYIKLVLTLIYFLDENLIGMLYSPERNVGKSLTLQTLSKAQGTDKAAHPLLCSGGDQTLSGVSLYVNYMYF
jgi:hypothetical protein